MQRKIHRRIHVLGTLYQKQSTCQMIIRHRLSIFIINIYLFIFFIIIIIFFVVFAHLNLQTIFISLSYYIKRNSNHQQDYLCFKLLLICSSRYVKDKKALEGRDKLTKFLIYAFKLVDALKSILLRQPVYELERIGTRFQKARQIMRLGKFISQYHSVIKLIREEAKDQFGRLVRILCHCIFSFYWVADNVTMLASFDLLDVPEYQINQSAMTVKFFALCFGAFLNLRSWFRLHHAEIKGRRELKYLKGADNLKKSKQVNKLVKQQWKMFLLCLKIYGDMLPSIAKSVIAKKLLKIRIPRILQALGGLTNAVVSCALVSL